MTVQISPGFTKFIAKLERRHPFSDRERAALMELPARDRDFEAHQQVVAEGDRRTICSMVRTGLVGRTKRLFDGEHKIVGFGLPGDLIDLESMLLPMADYGIVTYMPTTMTLVPHVELFAVSNAFPNIMMALWRDTLVDGAIRRARAVSNSRRPERARVAHLLLEFEARTNVTSEPADDGFDLPVTHQSLGEAIDLSATHVGHALSSLHDDGLIRIDRNRVNILQRDALQTLSGFEPGYLHIDGWPNGGGDDFDKRSASASAITAEGR